MTRKLAAKKEKERLRLKEDEARRLRLRDELGDEE